MFRIIAQTVTMPHSCIETECLDSIPSIENGRNSTQNTIVILVHSLFVCTHVLFVLIQLGLWLYFPPTPHSSHTTGLLVMDPHRLCSMIADVLRLTNRLSQTADDPSGIFQQSHLAMILSKYFPESKESEEKLPFKYLSVLESVGICRTLSDGTLFLPSGLAASFADVSEPLVWSESSVARLFRVPCLSSVFWSLLLQHLAWQLEAISQLFASNSKAEESDSLSDLHRKATFWRSGLLLRSKGCQALVRAAPGSNARPLSPANPTSLLSQTTPSSPTSASSGHEGYVNEIDVLVEASSGVAHIKLLQAITQSVVEVSLMLKVSS